MRSSIVAPLYFLLLTGIGLWVLDDYGISWDEAVQRRHGHVAMKYWAEHLGIEAQWDDEGQGMPAYGMLFQTVATTLEKVLGISDDRYAYYRLRHLLCFLFFVAAQIAFYRLLRWRWPRQRWFPLLGCLLLTLSPRIFAHAFFNPKDHILLVFYLVGTYTLVRYINLRTPLALIVHAVACGLALSTRQPAILLPLLMVAVVLWEDLRRGFTKGSWWWQLPLFAVISVAVLLPFNPYIYASSGDGLGRAVTNVANYGWNGTVLFRGEIIESGELPWYYVPFWIVITTPLVYLLFMGVGSGYALARLAGRLRRGVLYRLERQRADLVLLTLTFAPVVAVIVLESALYNGWRHLHFVYPGLLYVSLIGVDWIWRQNRFVAAGLLVIGLASGTYATVRMHPQQQVYFNLLAGDERLYKFDMDYWGIGYRQAFLEVAASVPEGGVRAVKCHDWPCIDNLTSLPPGTREKLRLETQWHLADYLATHFLFPTERDLLLGREEHFGLPVTELDQGGEVFLGVYRINQ